MLVPVAVVGEVPVSIVHVVDVVVVIHALMTAVGTVLVVVALMGVTGAFGHSRSPFGSALSRVIPRPEVTKQVSSPAPSLKKGVRTG
jgi:hypothetical protein